jgi:hypothetical protein
MKTIAALFFATAAVAPLHAQQPDADAMVRSIRLSATLQQMELKGVVRKQEQSAKEALPVHLFVKGNNMQFHLGNEKPFHIRMGDEKADLMEILDAKGSTRPFPTSRLAESVAGTDVSYEDLTLRFLYWSGAKFEGEENVNNAQCYKIRLNNPGREGAYGVVYVWVHKKYGAFWQIRAHARDKAGTPLKEFQVKEVMQLPDGKSYTIQQMKVSKLAGAADRVQSITYLEFEKPGKGGVTPKGRGR